MNSVENLFKKAQIAMPKTPVRVMLDTDIGPDVDDVGALALLHVLADANLCEIVSVTHCTTSPYGAPCIDVINRAYGRNDIPIGTLAEKDFLNQSEYRLFNQYLAEHYDHRFTCGIQPLDAAQVMVEHLQKQPDNSVVIVAIGPLVNLSNCLSYTDQTICQQEVLDLIKNKVRLTVIMGGSPNGLEWNFEMDPQSARHICSDWPTPIIFSTAEIGGSIITGRKWDQLPVNHPVYKAYQLHSPTGRSSWDLTAVWVSVIGYTPLFDITQMGEMKVDETGRSIFVEIDCGRHRCLLKVWDDEEIGEFLDTVINRLPDAF